MTLRQFRAFDINEQANAVWNGTFLGTVAEAKYNIHLYNVAHFYVKVYYSNKLNEIVKIRAFKTTSLLAPYLDNVNVNALKELL
jgi:hypothetical protein